MTTQCKQTNASRVDFHLFMAFVSIASDGSVPHFQKTVGVGAI